MAHLVETKGTELEGFWFACSCGEEGQVWDELAPAEMEAEVHVMEETL